MHDMMNRPDTTEAKMARADLFKLAQYSFKLFKMIGENQELEGWVQAKITKSADYIASVYHFMEYEMKVSEYGDHLESAEMYSESVRRVFEQKLTEAKRMAEAAKAKAKKDYDDDGKVESPKDEVWGSRAKAAAKSGKPFKEEFDKVGDTKKTRTGELTKTATGVKHKRTDYSDDEHGEAPSTVKQKSASEKKADKANDIKLPKHKGNTWGMKGGEKFGKKMEEGAKPDFLDMDKDGNKKEPMKKAVADKKVKEAAGKCNHTPKGKSCPVHGLKECGSMYEGAMSDLDADRKDRAYQTRQAKTTMKHIKDPTPGEKKAAKDIKPGIAGYKDRVAMLKSAEKDGRLKA